MTPPHLGGGSKTLSLHLKTFFNVELKNNWVVVLEIFD